jgi:Zn-dependent protease/predicted transcriptional regulator
MPEKKTPPAPTRGIKLFRISGIQISIDFSWFVIFFLILWSLSAGYFPRKFPGETVQNYWLAGILATILFFSSVIIHELAHSLTAIRHGMKIHSITLFIFGGVSSIEEEAKTPGEEFRIAIVGPVSSLVLAGIFWLISGGLRGVIAPIGVSVFSYLAYINLALALFNLVPGFPLDGGRVFRAIWWKWKGSITEATKAASFMGKGFAYGLMFIGGIWILSGFLLGGIWFILIGIFLKSAAEGSYKELLLRQSLDRVKVRDVMVREVETVPADMSLQKLINDYFLKFGYKGFPVARDGQVVGLVSISHVKDLPEEERAAKTVGDVMNKMGDDVLISPDAPLLEALTRMQSLGLARLLVMEQGKLLGMITRTAVMRFLEIKNILHH